MFLLSSISIFKSNKWSRRFLTISATLPLSDLIVGAENVTSVSGKVYLMRVFSFKSLSKIYLDVERMMMCFGFLRRIGCT